MIVPDSLVWAGGLLLAVYFTDAAYDHLPFSLGQEVGYASILTWIRATGFMFLSAFSWLTMSLMTVTINNCSLAYAQCYTSPTYETTTSTVFVSQVAQYLPTFFQGLFWINLVVGIAITMYLVLPTERLPKSLQSFGKQKPLEQHREE